MATKAQVKAFIKKIAPCAQYAYKLLGKVRPSVCIGMACVESAYGTAGSCKHNSFLGQKVGSGKTAKRFWNGTFFKTKTKEEYKVGVHTVITDAFRSYTDIQQCVLNYYELLNTSLYRRVQANVDYRTQMLQIKLCEYMTSSTEVNSVIRIIERYNLTQYDKATTTPVSIPSNPYSVPTQSVKMGSKGENAKWLQCALNNKGYSLVVDGNAGKKTIDALKDFQKNNGLKADGICGKQTIAKLV